MTTKLQQADMEARKAESKEAPKRLANIITCPFSLLLLVSGGPAIGIAIAAGLISGQSLRLQSRLLSTLHAGRDVCPEARMRHSAQAGPKMICEHQRPRNRSISEVIPLEARMLQACFRDRRSDPLAYAQNSAPRSTSNKLRPHPRALLRHVTHHKMYNDLFNKVWKGADPH